MRFFITKKILVWLVIVLAVALVAMSLSGCIPVTVRPEFDEQGLPIAMPVTPVGSVGLDGTFAPIYPVSDKAPTSFDWGTIGAVVGSITTALLAAYGINLRGAVAKAKTAIGLVAELADCQAEALTPEAVKQNKVLAAQVQEAAGVRDLIQKVRGK